MKCTKVYTNATQKLAGFKDLPPLFFRLILAYGFYGPAMMKWGNINGIADWFGSMGIPFPTLNAYMAASTEMAAVILLLRAGHTYYFYSLNGYYGRSYYHGTLWQWI